MTTNNPDARRLVIATVDATPAQRIPLAVLATLPEKLRLLAEATKDAASASSKDFDAMHMAARRAFDAASSAANCSVNTFDELSALVEKQEVRDAWTEANRAQRLITAIYKAAGNFHGSHCFKTTFGVPTTLDATVAALHECANTVTVVVRPFGY